MADVIIVYDSKTGNTAKAAEEVASGVKESGASVEMKNVDDATVDDLRKAKGIILGSPNISDNYSAKMRDFVNNKLAAAKPSDKVGAVFGTHKWNNDNIKRLQEDMMWIGMRLVADGINVHRHADEDTIKKLRELGKKVGQEATKK